MNEHTHDSFPIRLEGNRRAYLLLPVDFNKRDAEHLIKHVNFIAECADHALHDYPRQGGQQNG